MPALISDKFRIFNAKQFLESLSEGPSDASAERSRMYFFVGRPQGWDAYLEIFGQNATAFNTSDFVYVAEDDNGTYTYANSPFKATIVAAYENSLVLSNVSGTAAPAVNSAPLPGSTLAGFNGTADTGAEANTGVYRYATEDAPPAPIDNQNEKYGVYDEIISAKRITDEFARAVITRFDWNLLAAEPRFDMYKPDYAPTDTGLVGKLGVTGATSLAAAKYYVINSNYEVFKCIYNGEFPGTTSPNPVYEPKTTPSAGQGTFDGEFFHEAASKVVAATGSGYIWKYLFTIPTGDVLRFLSTNFMPIVPSISNPANTRYTTEQAAVDGAIDVVLVEQLGAGQTNGTYYAPVVGDGQVSGAEAVVRIVISGGAIASTEIIDRGAGYTYGSVFLENGVTIAGNKYGLFTDAGLTTAVTGFSAVTLGALEVVIPPQGGHGSDMELELNAKRVMTNIRLEYAEGNGDFPVDNDFRRIGILKDPYAWGTTSFATLDTLNGLYAVRVTPGSATEYIVDEPITQSLAGGGTAIGTVVSYSVDDNGVGTLKYFQNPELHADSGIVRPFEAGANIVGSQSLAASTVKADENGTVAGIGFSSGIGLPEIEPNSGDLIYVENRRLITRAPDQIEDIKLVIEF
jgi:hypothetical protein